MFDAQKIMNDVKTRIQELTDKDILVDYIKSDIRYADGKHYAECRIELDCVMPLASLILIRENEFRWELIIEFLTIGTKKQYLSLGVTSNAPLNALYDRFKTDGVKKDPTPSFLSLPTPDNSKLNDNILTTKPLEKYRVHITKCSLGSTGWYYDKVGKDVEVTFSQIHKGYIIWNDSFCRVLAKEDCKVVAAIL